MYLAIWADYIGFGVVTGGLCNRMDIITPKEFVGSLMELAQQRRGEYVDMLYLTEARTTLVYDLPLAEVHTPLPPPAAIYSLLGSTCCLSSQSLTLSCKFRTVAVSLC